MDGVREKIRIHAVSAQNAPIAGEVDLSFIAFGNIMQPLWRKSTGYVGTFSSHQKSITGGCLHTDVRHMPRTRHI